ncbi:prolyl oligopeptidase family serine peptidase [Streptomyces sp. MMG1121]|uniref:S9 family peptidase n=1 Tax=Streptomyces sp. MMG1121 TaxID=1415544 RepID=UPI0006AE031B|nr:prolyl oligopeptidase family serine peptidase [Streptomyces sp. MMG1121]KOV61242.1 peptidase S9 [Streptomyces sp. MMG1121]
MTNSYRVFVTTLPDVCPTDPSRMVFTADAGGRCEVFTWDAAVRRARQVTDSAEGTVHRAIDAAGYVWWFEEDATEYGHWWFQHFDGGPRLPGLPGARAGRPRGLAVTADGTVAAAVERADRTVAVVGPRGRAPREVWSARGSLRLGGITPDGALIALASSADDAAAVRVVSRAGRTVVTLPGSTASGPGEGAAPGPADPTPAGTRLWCQGFSPRSRRRELLLVRDLGESYVLETWTPEEGLRTHHWCTFDTEVSARWYPDARAVLVRQDRRSRSLLYRVDLDARQRVLVPTPSGSVLDAAPRAAGAVDYLWTDTAHPPVLRATDGIALPPCHSATAVPGRHTDLWTPSPSGRVHTLLSLPERPGSKPPPAVFLVHGGPADHDRDAYDATVHSLVASGYAVARVNYRGSTGYGPRWRREFPAGVGHTQVEDLAAVRADLVARGLVARDASALWGVSWGAYLVLLAMGSRPGLWQAGIAVKPVADWVAAHRATTPALRALDVRLFGGTPDEVPERYASSSPLTWAAAVTAPLLVVGAAHDAKCPPGQIRTYLAALAAADVPHEAMWLATGHDGYDGATHVAVLRRSLCFLRDRLPAAASGALTRPPAPAGGPRPR